MPAHLRPIIRNCFSLACERPATQTLYTMRNERVGDYCDKHAQIHLEKLLVQEEEERRAREAQKNAEEFYSS